MAENDEALKFQMIIHNEQYLVDYDSPEIYVSISSGCIKCVFLNRFVTKLLVSIINLIISIIKSYMFILY